MELEDRFEKTMKESQNTEQYSIIKKKLGISNGYEAMYKGKILAYCTSKKDLEKIILDHQRGY